MTDQILGGLEGTSARLRKDQPDGLAKLQVFIRDGREFRGFWKAMIHGDIDAPPTSTGLEYRERFFRWWENAGGLVRSDMELVRRMSERDPGGDMLETMDVLRATREALERESERRQGGT